MSSPFLAHVERNKKIGSVRAGKTLATTPRDRIVTAARELIRKHGIRGVGVDAIAEAAGSNKMTLYRHFGSKDELVVACLNQVVEEVERDWLDIANAFPGDPRRQLMGWLQMASNYLHKDVRGCDFANAAVELAESDHPAKQVIETFKVSQLNILVSLCRAAGASQPELLADALVLLLEGARVCGQSVGSEGPSARFFRVSEAVIASFGVEPVRETAPSLDLAGEGR